MTKKKKTDSIWYSSDATEKARIREFWLQLSEQDRKSLVKLEKEAVLKKMKEQQRSNCSCNVCGRKKSVIEEELEILYDAYYEELEHFANDQNKTKSKIIHTHHIHPEEKSSAILNVADDFLKNGGQKFLCLMEELASQKLKFIEEQGDKDGVEESDEEEWDDVCEEEDEDGELYDEDEDESASEQQRMIDGRRMFQIFAAKMFEQRVLTAYREKVAQERQRRLLEELEEEEKAKEGAKLEKERKKAAKRALKKQKEEERLKSLEKEKLEVYLKEKEENDVKQKELEEKRIALEKEEKEKARALELKKQQEEKRRAKEEADRNEAKIQLQKKLAKEQMLQKKKAQEQLLQKEREEAKLRIQKEAEEKAKEDRKKEKDEKVKAAKRERKERKAREKLTREASSPSIKSVSEKGSKSSLHLSSLDSESLHHSPSFNETSFVNNLSPQQNHFGLEKTASSQPFTNSLGISTVPVHSESSHIPIQSSGINPPGLSHSITADQGMAFSPLSYGLSLPPQDLNSRNITSQSTLNPSLGFMGQASHSLPMSSLGSESSLSGRSTISRHSTAHTGSRLPPGMQIVTNAPPLFVDEAATLRLSGLYDEADELVSSPPVGNADLLLSAINKAPASSWNSLMGTSNQLSSNPRSNPHLGLENLWSQPTPSIPHSTSIRQQSNIPPHALTHQQFLQMQTANAFSSPSNLSSYPGLSPVSLGNTPLGSTSNTPWPNHDRFFESNL